MSNDTGKHSRFHETYGEVVKNLCQSCARRNPDHTLTCEAFPEAIPYAIFMGLFDHTHTYDYEGQDDHGLTYIAKS
jgi:hypothetical protein